MPRSTHKYEKRYLHIRAAIVRNAALLQVSAAVQRRIAADAAASASLAYDPSFTDEDVPVLPGGDLRAQKKIAHLGASLAEVRAVPAGIAW